MAGAVPLIPLFKFTDAAGKPLALGWVTVYQAGTTTLATAYSDMALTVPHVNPLQLDQNGETVFWLDPSKRYKFLLQDSNLVTVSGWPVDNIPGGASGDLAASTGASLVGYDGGTVQDVLDDAKPLQSYTALRAYTGRANTVRITSKGVAGHFLRDASDTTSADDGGTIIVDAAARRWKRLFDGPMNVLWFGAKGDGITDDTTAIQKAITAAGVGGTAFVPSTIAYYLLTAALVLAGQYLVGAWGGYRTGPTLRTNSLATPLIVTTAGKSSGLRNLQVQGISTSTGLIQLNGVDAVSNIGGNFSGRYGIQLTSTSIASLVEDVLLINMVTDRTGATQFGAIDIDGTDHYVNRVEANCSSGQSGSVSASKVAVSVYVRGSNCFVTNSIGEFGEQGWVVSGAKNRISNCRADRCMGDGFSLTGTQNVINGLHIMECGTVTANTYDGFVATGALNTISNLQIASQGSSTMRYGVNDTITSATQKNRYVQPFVNATVGTAKYNWGANQPSTFTLANSPARATNLATAVDVSQLTDVRFGYSAPTTVTTLSNGIPGQTVTCYVAAGTSTITFQQNATIKNRSAADTAVAAGQSISYRFLPDDNLWVQL